VIRHEKKRVKADFSHYYEATCELCNREIASSEWEGDGIQYRLAVIEHLLIHLVEQGTNQKEHASIVP